MNNELKIKLSDFDYKLPEGLIAQYAEDIRDNSKLLVLHRKEGKTEHKIFKDIITYLNPGDLLVLNDTKVFNARLIGKREGYEGKIEVLLAEKIDDKTYACLVRPYKRFKTGTQLLFGEGGLLKAEVTGEEDGFKKIRFNANGNFYSLLDKIGNVPLPPYIRRKPDEKDKERYQTIYAKNRGAIAAPTAGLHFTKDLLSSIEKKGIDTAHITLHVGYATFRSVKEEDVTKHNMHNEYFEISESAAEKINNTKKNGGKVVAVGTTTCRALESATVKLDTRYEIRDMKTYTNLFMYPGYNFKIIDGIITNFHLPKTTLLMLVSAFAGRENVMRAYSEAVKRNYRFYSYGDAMLIL